MSIDINNDISADENQIASGDSRQTTASIAHISGFNSTFGSNCVE
jgi:hypothetical protein